MAVLASDFGRVAGYIVALTVAFVLLLALIAAAVYAVSRQEWKLKHWVPAIAILISLAIALRAAVSYATFD